SQARDPLDLHLARYLECGADSCRRRHTFARKQLEFHPAVGGAPFGLEGAAEFVPDDRRRHEGSAAAAPIDEALRLQLHHRLADRRTADLEMSDAIGL